MIAEIGEFLLQVAIGFYLLQILLFKANSSFQKAAVTTSFACVSFSFLALIYSFVISDFSLAVVYQNSHSLKPLIYKISGAWGNHEGSLLMLLWVGSFYGYLYARKDFSKTALSTISAVLILLISFALFTSNPFEKILITPEEGTGLNPLLQDVGLAMHPPILYLGYLGFLVPFALAISCLLRGELTKKDAAIMRKWTNFAWGFLTLGIGLGSWWAYRELGWGGFWFWDPVENISLLPWLAGTALLHSIMVAEKRGGLLKWSALLAILTFCVALAGFFLVRSGLLTSVHAFAADPERGVFMLAVLVLISGTALIIYGARAHKLESEITYSSVSRETMILYNNLITCVLTATIFVGVIYPLILEGITGQVIAVGAPFYNKTIVPMGLVIFVLAALATKMNWTNDNANQLLKKMMKPIIGTIVFSGLLIAIFASTAYEVIAIISLLFLLITVISSFIKKREKNTPIILAHGGFALLGIGIAFASFYNEEAELLMRVDDKVNLAGFEIVMQDIEEGAGKNYMYRKAEFAISVGGKEQAKIYPEARIYPIEREQTSEAAIYKNIMSDLYIVIGEKSKGAETYAVRIYFKPLINLIWIGCFLMFMGGMARFFAARKSN